MNKLLLTILLIGVLVTPAMAKRTHGALFICTNKNDAVIMLKAASSNNKRLWKYQLQSNKCTVIPPGVEYDILDRGYYVDHVKIYMNNTSYNVWGAFE